MGAPGPVPGRVFRVLHPVLLNRARIRRAGHEAQRRPYFNITSATCCWSYRCSSCTFPYSVFSPPRKFQAALADPAQACAGFLPGPVVPENRYFQFFRNSLIVAGTTTAVALAVLSGYGLSASSSRGARRSSFSSSSPRCFPFPGAATLFLFFKAAPPATVIGLILAFVGISLAFSIWMLKSYFDTIPSGGGRDHRTPPTSDPLPDHPAATPRRHRHRDLHLHHLLEMNTCWPPPWPCPKSYPAAGGLHELPEDQLERAHGLFAGWALLPSVVIFAFLQRW